MRLLEIEYKWDSTTDNLINYRRKTDKCNKMIDDIDQRPLPTVCILKSFGDMFFILKNRTRHLFRDALDFIVDEEGFNFMFNEGMRMLAILERCYVEPKFKRNPATIV